jgi:hypothetical protein
LNEALFLNQNITAANAIESNLKAINILRIKFLRDGLLAETEWNEVRGIANLCFSTGGFLYLTQEVY